jgi:hypothetical protein
VATCSERVYIERRTGLPSELHQHPGTVMRGPCFHQIGLWAADAKSAVVLWTAGMRSCELRRPFVLPGLPRAPGVVSNRVTGRHPSCAGPCRGRAR